MRKVDTRQYRSCGVTRWVGQGAVQLVRLSAGGRAIFPSGRSLRPSQPPRRRSRAAPCRSMVFGQVGEEAAQAAVVLAEATVDDDEAEVAFRLEEMLEPLGDEHQGRRVGVLRPREVLREGLAAGVWTNH